MDKAGRLALVLVTLSLTAGCLDYERYYRPRQVQPPPEAIGERSQAEVRTFQAASGHPGGWPGHVVDHRIPLCAGGPDTAANMQWQTAAESYAKDAFERGLCLAMKAEGLTMVPVPAAKP